MDDRPSGLQTAIGVVCISAISQRPRLPLPSTRRPPKLTSATASVQQLHGAVGVVEPVGDPR